MTAPWGDWEAWARAMRPQVGDTILDRATCNVMAERCEVLEVEDIPPMEKWGRVVRKGYAVYVARRERDGAVVRVPECDVGRVYPEPVASPYDPTDPHDIPF